MSAATRTAEAADEILAWLNKQPRRSPIPEAVAPRRDSPEKAEYVAAPELASAVFDADNTGPAERVAAAPQKAGEKAGLWLADTDWLFHRLVIIGAPEDLRKFGQAIAGAGIIPWHYDLDRMEEDYFHMLVAPRPPQQRSLSIAGARIFARRLRDAVGRRHDLAASRVGRSQTCPFDLHAVLPVPQAILTLGPDAPEARAWLWMHWGTTQELRHVVDERPAETGRNNTGKEGHVRLSFWSADWTPWPVLQHLGRTWPTLRLDCLPFYDLP